MFLLCGVAYATANAPADTAIPIDAASPKLMESQPALIESILHGSSNDAALALRTITTNVDLGPASLPKILKRLNECADGLDLNILTEESAQPRWLCFFTSERYEHIGTRQGIILARYADFVRESPNFPERIEAQRSLLAAFLEELKHSPKGGARLAECARRCVLFEEVVTPNSEETRALLDFTRESLKYCKDWDRDTVSSLDSNLWRLALCAPEHFDEIYTLDSLIDANPETKTDIKSAREEVLLQISKFDGPISKAQYREIRAMDGQQLSNEITHYGILSSVSSVIHRELCGSKTARLKNWEYIWDLVVSNDADCNVLSSLAQPIDDSASAEEKAHVDVYIDYLYNAIMDDKGEYSSEYPRYLWRLIVPRFLDASRERYKDIPKFYAQQRIINLLVSALDTNKSLTLDRLLWVAGDCAWLNEEAAKVLNDRLRVFKIKMNPKSFGSLNLAEHERNLNSSLESALRDTELALEFFASEREKKTHQ